jgi:hypothetical protein
VQLSERPPEDTQQFRAVRRLQPVCWDTQQVRPCSSHGFPTRDGPWKRLQPAGIGRNYFRDGPREDLRYPDSVRAKVRYGALRLQRAPSGHASGVVPRDGPGKATQPPAAPWLDAQFHRQYRSVRRGDVSSTHARQSTGWAFQDPSGAPPLTVHSASRCETVV